MRSTISDAPPPELADLVLVAPGHPHDVDRHSGERLYRLFEHRCDQLRAGGSDAVAVDAAGGQVTYGQLDGRSNQLARHLLARGIVGGHRVAIAVDDPVQAYVAMLAVMKVNAAFVPLDLEFPAELLASVVADSGATIVLTQSHLKAQLRSVRAPLVPLDGIGGQVARRPTRRLSDAERGEPVDDLAYLIYTSGTTGRPKGVAIEHASICNFVRVSAEVYDIRPQDRVYQGMTIAFDFSVEEIWVPWAVGATLVPKPAGSTLLGMDLHDFLTEQQVTAMCCVPTLLATIEEDLPHLRFLLVSGEACPQDLIARWYKPGRRFLNVYGPTEATVTATWTTVHPDRPVTIGRPLPTYTTVILDREDPHHALPHGSVGEIGIAGIGLAAGYLGCDDLTDSAFIPDFLGITGNPSGRIYRTGDLGRVNEDGEIEYLGRIDLQVKIHGHRIDLTVIESALRHVPDVTAAVVDTFEPAPGIRELVGYYCVRTDTAPPEPTAISSQLRERLPSYMVPTWFEHVAAIPMTPQNKVDRRALPTPVDRIRGNGDTAHVGREPITAPDVTAVPDPMAPVQRTRSICTTLSRGPDLLVYVIATVCAIVVWLVLEQGFDRLALGPDRSGVLETALAVLAAPGLAGLLCLLVPLMRRLIRRSR